MRRDAGAALNLILVNCAGTIGLLTADYFATSA